eukprot:3476826-Prymnesium_polylepis.1
MTGDDCWAYLDMACGVGGEESIRARTWAGLKVKKREESEVRMPDDVRADDSEKGRSLRELLCLECDVTIEVDGKLCELISGGDMAAGHDGAAIDSPVAAVNDANGVRQGCCMRCFAGKPDWVNAGKIAVACRRTFAYQCVANHVNVFKLPVFKDMFPNHPDPICPECGETITDELVAREKAEMANAGNAAARKKLMATHSKSHRGAQRGRQPILPLEP